MSQRINDMPTLTVNAHVVLRLLTHDDEAEEYRLLMDNYDYFSKWIFWLNESFTQKHLHDDLEDTLQKYAKQEIYLMGVYVDDELVGAVDVRDIVPGESAEVGYFIAEKFTGRGLASTCTLKLIEYVRDKHHVPYFYLHTFVDNAASSRVAEKMGFAYERTVGDEVKEKRYGRHFVGIKRY